MLTRTFEYKGYDGEFHKDTYLFNLTEAELYELELSSVGGLNSMLNRLIREDKPEEIVKMFKKIILGSVGERSQDGRRFVKSEQISRDFEQTPAYSQLFVELVSSGEKMAAFIKGVIPEEVAKKIAEKEEADAELKKASEESNSPALSVVKE